VAEIYSGQSDPAPGAVGLFQTTPDRVRFDAGLDYLTVFSFSETGILRWQAKCCGATLFNTLRRPRIAFATMLTDRLQDDSPLGPVKSRAFVRKANGKRGHEGLAASLSSLIANAAGAAATGRWKQTPFFDLQTGHPVRTVHVVSADERAALNLSPS
jgi:hypothetical protein